MQLLAFLPCFIRNRRQVPFCALQYQPCLYNSLFRIYTPLRLISSIAWCFSLVLPKSGSILYGFPGIEACAAGKTKERYWRTMHKPVLSHWFLRQRSVEQEQTVSGCMVPPETSTQLMPEVAQPAPIVSLTIALAIPLLWRYKWPLKFWAIDRVIDSFCEPLSLHDQKRNKQAFSGTEMLLAVRSRRKFALQNCLFNFEAPPLTNAQPIRRLQKELTETRTLSTLIQNEDIKVGSPDNQKFKMWGLDARSCQDRHVEHKSGNQKGIVVRRGAQVVESRRL